MKTYKIIFEDGSSFLVDANDPKEAKNIAAGNYFDLPAEHRPKGSILDIVKYNPYDESKCIGINDSGTRYEVYVDNPENANRCAEAISILPSECLNRLCNYCSIGATVNDMDLMYKISAYLSALFDLKIIGMFIRQLLYFHFATKLKRDAYENDN